MTPKISLIIGIAVTALAFGVPTALGERQLVGPAEPDASPTSTPTSARRSRSRVTHRLSRVTHPRPPRSTRTSRCRAHVRTAMAASRASERATLVEQASSSVGSRDPDSASSPTLSTSSASEIEWPQIGIGFGLGVLLVAGLWLAIRMTRVARSPTDQGHRDPERRDRSQGRFRHLGAVYFRQWRGPSPIEGASGGER